jgi:HEAT repeat protein
MSEVAMSEVAMSEVARAQAARAQAARAAASEGGKGLASGGSGVTPSHAAHDAGSLPSAGAKGEGATSSSALEASVGQLGRLKPGAETNQAVAALVRQGEAAVAEIGLQLAEHDADYGWRHTAVRVLQGVNSEQSRAILRRMALGEAGERDPGLEDWAARALIACDRREAWALLASATPEVLTSALNAVVGQPVDEKHMPLLRKCLAHQEDLVRWRAADVLADDPTGKRSDETLQVVAEALAAIPRLPNVNAPYRQFPPTGWTVGEACYHRYVYILVRVKADDEALRALAKRMEGRGRDAVLLALAQRGDKTVHDDLVKLAQDSKADLFRAWAVTALRKIGTSEDLPLLRTLAKTDPLVREGPSGPGDDNTRPTHPVRQAAEDTIRTLEKKSKEAGK